MAMGTKKTNNSFFSAANETLITKCYFSLMDNDMESLSYSYQYHRREIRGVNEIKQNSKHFVPAKVFHWWAITLST